MIEQYLGICRIYLIRYRNGRLSQPIDFCLQNAILPINYSPGTEWRNISAIFGAISTAPVGGKMNGSLIPMVPTTKLGRGIQSCCHEGWVQKIKELPPLAKEHWQEGRCPVKMAMLMIERATRSAERYFTGCLQQWLYNIFTSVSPVNAIHFCLQSTGMGVLQRNWRQVGTQKHRQASWVVKIRQKIREAVFHGRQLLNLRRLQLLKNTKSAIHTKIYRYRPISCLGVNYNLV